MLLFLFGFLRTAVLALEDLRRSLLELLLPLGDLDRVDLIVGRDLVDRLDPLEGSSATRALNSGLWVLRFLLIGGHRARRTGDPPTLTPSVSHRLWR